MDSALLLFGLVFGSIGLGFFLYGKKAVRLVPLLTGLLLMVIPYFFTSVLWLIVVCLTLTTVPYFFRDQA